MYQYITTAIVAFFAGLIGLTDKQAATRTRFLKKVPGRPGVYEILGQIQFKVGEIIGLENPDKIIRSKVDPMPETLEIMAALEAERIQGLAEKKARDLFDLKEAERAAAELAAKMAAQGDPDTAAQAAQGAQVLADPAAGGDQDLSDPVNHADLAIQMDLDLQVDPDVVRAAAQAIEDGQVTASGAPSVAAMEKILGFDVTAELRDLAWDEVKKGASHA